MKSVIKVGIIGLGTVGRGVYRILTENEDNVSMRTGTKLQVEKIVVRNASKNRGLDLPAGILDEDVNSVLDNPEIDIVVEVIGGTSLAREYVAKALKNGKSVVTANKDLIAQYGKELFSIAAESGADLLFEASVGGGIPIIRPLKQCLAGNRIEQIMGIINGTTNYMLTKMTEEGSDFEEVLKEAQEKGYAEADPTSDVEGLDAARKTAILASIAFATRVTFDDVYVEGITKISANDIQYAKELGYVIKLLGIAKEGPEGVEVRVHPTFVPKAHPIASVSDVFNAIFVKGHAVGETMFYGRGAGELPTASAVVADIMDAGRNLINNDRRRISCTCFTEKNIKNINEIESRYYLRLKVVDKPGVLAAIAGILGEQFVSIHSVIQKQACKEEFADLVLITHQVIEGNLQAALKEIENLDAVEHISNVIRVEA